MTIPWQHVAGQQLLTTQLEVLRVNSGQLCQAFKHSLWELTYCRKQICSLPNIKAAFHPYVNNLCFVVNLVLPLRVPPLIWYDIC